MGISEGSPHQTTPAWIGMLPAASVVPPYRS
nr:MAG TPA: hypothetical protein [Caudoviricetes sp.]